MSHWEAMVSCCLGECIWKKRDVIRKRCCLLICQGRKITGWTLKSEWTVHSVQPGERWKDFYRRNIRPGRKHTSVLSGVWIPSTCRHVEDFTVLLMRRRTAREWSVDGTFNILNRLSVEWSWLHAGKLIRRVISPPASCSSTSAWNHFL